MSSKGHIAVIGAGVTGLTTALLLAEAGYKISIVAAHVPGDLSIEYTSPWGGAQWRTHASSNEPMSKWDIETYEYWVELMEKEKKEPELEKSGIKMYDSLVYWDGPITEDLWWTSRVQDFRFLSPEDAPIHSINTSRSGTAPAIHQGAKYRAMTANVTQYLEYLRNRVLAYGVTILKAHLATDGGIAEALEKVETVLSDRGKIDCFINASGIGAAKLCGDEAVHPIRGQTILVKGEASAIRTRLGDGHISYCVPRAGSGASILGGTKQVGNWSGEVDEPTTEAILERCKPLLPELLTGPNGTFEIISVQCGLRPGRTGGPRVEEENIDGKKVVHAYGHAGAGYQNSIGSARTVVRLVEGLLGESQK